MDSYGSQGSGSPIGDLTTAEFLDLEYKLLSQGKLIVSAEAPVGPAQADVTRRMQQIEAEIAALRDGPNGAAAG